MKRGLEGQRGTGAARVLRGRNDHGLGGFIYWGRELGFLETSMELLAANSEIGWESVLMLLLEPSYLFFFRAYWLNHIFNEKISYISQNSYLKFYFD